jgi:hypothetical protein
LGGGVTAAPAAASWAPGRIDVFVKGTDNALHHKWYQGGWSGWEFLGGVLTSAPAAASWAPGRIDVAVRGTDNSAWHTFYQAGWHGFDPLGGVLASAPAMSTWGPGRLDVYVEGSNGGPSGPLYHQWFAGAWSGWHNDGGQLTAAPAAVSWAPGRADVVVRGTDNAVWHTWGTPPIAFGDGLYRIGVNIPAGTYRTRSDVPLGGCNWTRFDAVGNEIISGISLTFHDVVTILPSDGSFGTSGCGTWTSDISPITASPTAPFADGTWMVNVDIAPGTWQATGGPGGCSWERLSGFTWVSQVIATDSIPTVMIAPGDAGFFSDSCGTWTKVG